MTNLFKNKIRLTIFWSIVLISLLSSNVYAQNCAELIREFNKMKQGIPTARIHEYENCVEKLSEGNTEEKSLLIVAYKRLIDYYEVRDNNTMVEIYRKKLQRIKN